MEEKKSFWKSVNPTLKEKMDENPNITVIGIFWAGYWRLSVIIAVVAIVFAVLAAILGSIH